MNRIQQGSGKRKEAFWNGINYKQFEGKNFKSLRVERNILSLR